MSGRQPSRGVEAVLDELYEAYEGFAVNQTTVAVGPEEFAPVAARGDVAEVRVRVEGADGVLAVPDGADDGWAAPGGVAEDLDRPLWELASELVAEQTGVECQIADLLRVSLSGIQCEETGEEVWRLVALFDATVESSGDAAEEVAWRERLPEASPAF